MAERIKLEPNSNESKLIMINGPGGCGKTFLYNTILSDLRAQNKTAIAVASSGIAANLLDSGTTGNN